MVRTPEGRILRLPKSTIVRIGSRVRRSGLAPLVRLHYRGNLFEAVRRAVFALARCARRLATARHPGTGRRFLILSSFAGGREYDLIVSRPDELQHEILAVRLASRTSGREAQDSDATRIANLAILERILKKGVPLADAAKWTRDGQIQVDLTGTPLRSGSIENQPDRAYVTSVKPNRAWTIDGRPVQLDQRQLSPASSRRMIVNIETDTDPRMSADHQARMNRLDKNALNIGFIHDERTGQILAARVSPAGSDQWHSVTTPKEVAALLRNLPKARYRVVGPKKEPIFTPKQRTLFTKDPGKYLDQVFKQADARVQKQVKRSTRKSTSRKTKARPRRESEFELPFAVPSLDDRMTSELHSSNVSVCP